MAPRIDYTRVKPEALRAMSRLEHYLETSTI